MSRPSRSPVRSVTTATTIGRRQAVVGELAQQPVLALGEAVGQLLDDVRRPVALRPELDEAHDVAVQPEHAVHVRQVPVVEVGGERQQPEVRVVRRIGELQPHRPRIRSRFRSGSRSPVDHRSGPKLGRRLRVRWP